MSKVLEVILFPHETLRKRAAEVKVFDEKLSELTRDMIETMYAYKGIGLAANQVDVLQRVFVLDVHWRGDPDQPEKKVDKAPEIFVNPEVLTGIGEMEYEEGCLSIPKMYGFVKRNENIIVRYQDLKGVSHEANFTELKAIAYQHELDHLNGVLFFDHLSPFKRRTLIEKFAKLQLEAKKEKEDE